MNYHPDPPASEPYSSMPAQPETPPAAQQTYYMAYNDDTYDPRALSVFNITNDPAVQFRKRMLIGGGILAVILILGSILGIILVRDQQQKKEIDEWAASSDGLMLQNSINTSVQEGKVSTAVYAVDKANLQVAGMGAYLESLIYRSDVKDGIKIAVSEKLMKDGYSAQEVDKLYAAYNSTNDPALKSGTGYLLAASDDDLLFRVLEPIFRQAMDSGDIAKMRVMKAQINDWMPNHTARFQEMVNSKVRGNLQAFAIAKDVAGIDEQLGRAAQFGNMNTVTIESLRSKYQQYLQINGEISAVDQQMAPLSSDMKFLQDQLAAVPPIESMTISGYAINNMGGNDYALYMGSLGNRSEYNNISNWAVITTSGRSLNRMEYISARVRPPGTASVSFTQPNKQGSANIPNYVEITEQELADRDAQRQPILAQIDAKTLEMQPYVDKKAALQNEAALLGNDICNGALLL